MRTRRCSRVADRETRLEARETPRNNSIVDFRLLGPFEVSVAGDRLPLGGPTQRAILARLVLSANDVVARERLIEDVWGNSPPAEVDASLRVYVARLRRLLANGDAVLETYR